MQYYHAMRGGGEDLSQDVRATPLAEDDYSNLPPTIFFAAECDPLADDGEVYCDRLSKADVKAQFVREIGLTRGYLRARSTVKKADATFSNIINVMEILANGRWDYG